MKPAPPVTRYLAMVPSYRVVGKTELAEIRGIVNIAAVENQGLLHQSFDAPEVGAAKLVPFSQNQQSRSAVQRVVAPVRVLDAVAENFSRLFHRLRMEGLDPRALAQQPLDDVDRRRIAHVVGARLERQPPNGESQPVQFAEMSFHFGEEQTLLALVYLLHRVQQRPSGFGAGHADHGADVLGEA